MWLCLVWSHARGVIRLENRVIGSSWRVLCWVNSPEDRTWHLVFLLEPPISVHPHSPTLCLHNRAALLPPLTNHTRPIIWIKPSRRSNQGLQHTLCIFLCGSGLLGYVFTSHNLKIIRLCYAPEQICCRYWYYSLCLELYWVSWILSAWIEKTRSSETATISNMARSPNVGHTD